MPAHQADRLRAPGQYEAARHLEGALGGDGAANVARVALATGVFDVLADCIQLIG